MTTKTKSPKVAARTPAPARTTSKPKPSGNARTQPGERLRNQALNEIGARLKRLGDADAVNGATSSVGAVAHSEQDNAHDGPKQDRKEQPGTKQVHEQGRPGKVSGGRAGKGRGGDNAPGGAATVGAASGGGNGPDANGANDAQPAATPHETVRTGRKGREAGKGAKGEKGATDAAPKRMGGLDIAFNVLAAAGKPMSCKDIVGEMLAKKLWSTTGKTPESTIYAAIIREIAAKGNTARFKKTARGQFEAVSVAAETID